MIQAGDFLCFAFRDNKCVYWPTLIRMGAYSCLCHISVSSILLVPYRCFGERKKKKKLGISYFFTLV